MRRYEFVEGNSKKFWEIELDDASFTTRWGRIGTDGQEKTQDFDSPQEARAAHDKLVAEKEKKGYKLVGGSDPDARPLTAKVPSNDALEAKLFENRDDVKTWAVYADWLIEQGEPWGEIIAKAAAGQPDNGKQKQMEGSVIPDDDGATVEWKHGVIDHFDFQPEDYDSDVNMEAVLTSVLKHPAGRLVRKLTLGLQPNEDTEWHMEGPIKAIVAAGPLPLLEELDMSPDAEHMDQPSWRRVGDMRGIWKAVPRLKTLLLQGAVGSDDGTPIKLGDIDAPHLEKFVFESGGLDGSVPKDLGRAKLPKLKYLELQFGREDYGNTCTVKSLDGILQGDGLPALQTLALRNSEWERELIEAVARSKILKQLKVVDFAMGVMCREATEALLEHAAAFKHLDTLVLDDNYFLEDQQAQLKAALPNIDFGTQKDLDGDPDDEYSRYTTVGE